MIRSNNFGFTHIYYSTNDLREDASNKKKFTFILLHGTGGNEHDLMFLGKEIEPNVSLLSPRGNVLENGMPRFFRRLSEGVFDLEDLKFRTHELADFIQNC